MLAIGGQTAELNWLTMFEGTHIYIISIQIYKYVCMYIHERKLYYIDLCHSYWTGQRL